MALAISVLHDDFVEHSAVQLLLSNACQQQLMYKSTGFSNRFNNHNWTSFFSSSCSTVLSHSFRLANFFIFHSNVFFEMSVSSGKHKTLMMANILGKS